MKFFDLVNKGDKNKIRKYFILAGIVFLVVIALISIFQINIELLEINEIGEQYKSVYWTNLVIKYLTMLGAFIVIFALFTSFICYLRLFHGNRFCEVSRLVGVISAADCGFIRDYLGGDKYLTHASALEKLDKLAGGKEAQLRIEQIKTANKKRFADYMYKEQGVIIDPNSIFDVQAKRLHEYKRQLLNVMHIIYLYQKLHDDRDFIKTPQTFLFGAKAAPGYAVAKRIIRLINSLADCIDKDPVCKDRLKVVFMENYRVSLAEKLIPAADISEQISLSGTEASGTGNMKLMINGAVTLGTMDGANVEIHEAVGDDNILIFGMSTPEAESLKHDGYNPMNYYSNNSELRKVIDFINAGINGKTFPEIGSTILHHVPYMVLADFADYVRIQNEAEKLYADRDRWNKMMLMNIAGAGRFAADRAVNEYARDIWHTEPVKGAIALDSSKTDKKKK